jgi:ribosome maturation factor RimP
VNEVAELTVAGRVRDLVEPPLTADGFEIVDIEHTGRQLRISVDRAGGIDLEAVSEATRQISALLDEHDVVPGTYALEVSSPGIERPLRTPEHFARFVGTTVAVRTKPGVAGERRVKGPLEAADGEGVVVAGRRMSYDDVERARTVFVWPAPAAKAATARKPRPQPKQPAQSKTQPASKKQAASAERGGS